MIDEYNFIEYIRKRCFTLLEEGKEEVSIDGVIERFKEEEEEEKEGLKWVNN